MSTTINTGWLKDNNGEKFAPKTLVSQVLTPEGISFEEKIQAQLENIDSASDVELTKAEYDALGDVVLTDGKTYFITDIDGGNGGSGGTIIANTDGIVINVEIGNWVAQSNGTYTNTISVEGVSVKDVYDISLCGDYTEEQAHAFDFLVTSIDTFDNKVVLTASEEITVAFSIILRGRVNLEDKNVFVSDLSATSIAYDNSESNMAATDMQNAIDELATTVNGIVVNVTADSWDLQKNGSYKKIIPVEQLTGKEVLDVCLYPGDTHTEEQILAYSELITSIDTIEGRLVLTATEELTVGFKILLYGKIGFEVSVGGNGNGEGTGNTTSIDITQAEYDELVEYNAVEPDVNYYITDATNISNTGNTSSDVFVSTKDYVVGDYCIYGNSLYKFISDKPAGEWDESSVVATSVGNEIKELNAIIDEQNKNIDNQNEKFEKRVGNIDGYLDDWSTIDFARYSGRPHIRFVREDNGETHEIKFTSTGIEFYTNGTLVWSK